MSEDAKAKLMRDIDSGNKNLQRDTEDAQAELDQEQGKIMQELGNKMMAIIEKYATAERLSRWWWTSAIRRRRCCGPAQTIDITGDIVKLYDQANPWYWCSGGTAAPKTGASPAALTPKPPAPTTPTSVPPAQKKK